METISGGGADVTTINVIANDDDGGGEGGGVGGGEGVGVSVS